MRTRGAEQAVGVVHRPAADQRQRRLLRWQVVHVAVQLIYLNGPPPGARITVKVGAATCTTSD
jgi:hypothetical protein